MKKLVCCIFVIVFGIMQQNCFAEEESPKQQSSNVSILSKEVSDIVGKVSNSFYPYRQNYIGWSAYNSEKDDKGQLKFQFSLKYEIYEGSDLFFGYTQKSFWSIQKISAPFSENNFAPELFYVWHNKGNGWAGSHIPHVQLGIARHESTGEAGAGSRGWNLSYIEPTFQFGEHLSIIPKLWAPVFFLSKSRTAPDNPDIFDYFGYGDITAKYAFDERSQLSATFRHGTKGNAYGVLSQLDIGISTIAKLFDKTFKFNPTFFVQVWNGYGESLKKYNRNTTDVVLGISAIR